MELGLEPRNSHSHSHSHSQSQGLEHETSASLSLSQSLSERSDRRETATTSREISLEGLAHSGRRIALCFSFC
jgi:hypothetical protein